MGQFKPRLTNCKPVSGSFTDNAANPNPIRATFRLDGGFTSRENLYWLIEMGYDVYTRGRFPKVRDDLSAKVTDETDWRRVGNNANMTAWGNTTVDAISPIRSMLLCFITIPATPSSEPRSSTAKPMLWLTWMARFLPTTADRRLGWYQRGAKRLPDAPSERTVSGSVALQEYLACFAANFVRLAAEWLTMKDNQHHFLSHRSSKWFGWPLTRRLG
ncbi:MAG: hypothetical protein IPH82_19600 [Chloroflexi bacterium]|nr:hypothetical protein [Chloroflexota bacterium]